MIYRSIFSYLLILTLALFHNYAVANPAIYTDNLDDAIVLANDLNVDILVVFSADWCGNCTKMKKDLQLNPDTIDDMIICYINIDNNKSLAKKYRIRNIPDYRIIRKNQEVQKKVGYTDLTTFKDWLNQRNK